MPTDIPFSVGPIQPPVSDDTPIWIGTGQDSPVIFRTAKVINSSPNRDAYLTLAAYSRTTDYYNFIKDLYCPAGSTQIVQMDATFHDDGFDSLVAQQVVDQRLGNLDVSQAVAPLVDATDLTSYTTASYTMTAGELYVAFVHIKNTQGGQTFTGTHSGETWTFQEVARVNGGGDSINAYTHLATATSAGTTTFASNAGMQGCIIQICRVQGLANPNAPVAWDDVTNWAGERSSNRMVEAWFTLDVHNVCGSRLFCVQAQTATGWTWEKEYTEIFDNNLGADNVSGSVGWAKSAGVHGEALHGAPPLGTTTGADKCSIMMDVHDTAQVLWLTMDGVRVTDA